MWFYSPGYIQTTTFISLISIVASMEQARDRLHRIIGNKDAATLEDWRWVLSLSIPCGKSLLPPPHIMQALPHQVQVNENDDNYDDMPGLN